VIAVDTNLLVYAHRLRVPEHRAALRTLERARRDARGWGIALRSVTEFWSVVTHPAASGRASTPAEARAFFETLTGEAGGRIWMPGEKFRERLLALAARLDVRGPRIFDLEIALTAFDNGASEIWTLDGSFITVPGLKVLRPF
jgi:predicted nucleic acid-binding protein